MTFLAGAGVLAAIFASLIHTAAAICWWRPRCRSPWSGPAALGMANVIYSSRSVWIAVAAWAGGHFLGLRDADGFQLRLSWKRG